MSRAPREPGGPGRSQEPAYDRLGQGYAAVRRTDPRLRDALWQALGDCRTVVDVGAGTGSYEPPTTVAAVEPSMTMIRQRPAEAAPAVRAVAEALPLRDGAADGALAVLTIHHWRDWRAGVAEMRRVARRVVVLTWDQAVVDAFWLFDYLPEGRELDRARHVPVAALVDALGGASVTTWEVPRDCRDGFLAAYWARPDRYLDEATHPGMSLFGALPATVVDGALDRLRRDLDDGTWQRRYGHLLEQETFDAGYRIVAGPRPA